ncbi:aromatic acid exporter family protein [Streptomyces ficellus]|uniref:Aromatic acid exporter family protein n=1 Tax=Streptomyces ficellus TaxID=1977088 RepID=A0ABT7Z165_9ACTN|nr:aromatic acid exporter family protein [Streptomyces ficellus]MDN3293229.1 aromatic acid exporter family protein [Streptomyces ficellus]
MSPAAGAAALWHRIGWEAAAVGESIRRALSGPGPERDMAVQSLKAAGAAILAWAVAGWWWKAPLALMAPWTAVALVQSTVYRSVRAGLQQVVVIATGTVLAAAAAGLTGDTMAAMALVLPLTVLLGNYPRFGDQGIYASTTALFVLVYGSYSGFDILHRLLETLLGAVIGIGVNALILPPVHLRHAHESLCRLPQDGAELLRTMAEGIERGYGRPDAQEWHSRARRFGTLLADLRNARTWSRESYRFNPATRIRRRPEPELPSTRWDAAWERVADHLTALTGMLAEAAGDNPRLRPPPDSVLGEVPPLLHALADVCRADCLVLSGAGHGDGPDREAAMTRAWAAHARLKARVVGQDHETATSVGGLAAETQQLLYDLEDARMDNGRPPRDGPPDA